MEARATGLYLKMMAVKKLYLKVFFFLFKIVIKQDVWFQISNDIE